MPPLERVNLDEIPERVRDKRCFVLHAPRQAGKTFRLARVTDTAERRHRGQLPYRPVENGTARAGGPRITIRWPPRLFDKGIRRDTEPLRQRRYLAKVEQPLAAENVRHDTLSTDLR